MKITTWFVTLFSMLLTTVPVNSVGAPGLSVHEIITRANDVQLNTSYKVEIISAATDGFGETSRFVLFQKIGLDGIRYRLKKPVSGNGTIFLENAYGVFTLIGNTAIKTERTKPVGQKSPIVPIRKDQDTFIVNGREAKRDRIGEENFARLEAWSTSQGGNEQGVGNIQNVELQEIVYHDIPCYFIVFNTDTADGVQIYEMTIGREDFFTYRTRIFNSKGKLVSDLQYENLVFYPDLDEDLFRLPAEMKVVVAKSEKEEIQLTVKASEEKIRSVSKAKRVAPKISTAKVRYFFHQNIRPLSVISGLSATVLLAVAIALKIISRRQTWR